MKSLILSLILIGSIFGGINTEVTAMQEHNEHVLPTEDNVMVFDRHAAEEQNFEVLSSNNSLIQAVDSRNFYEAKHLLANKALFWAIKDGDLTRVENLVLHEGANINARMLVNEMDEAIFTPLSFASRYGHTDIVNFIIGYSREIQIDLDLNEALIAALGGLHNADDITIPDNIDTTDVIDSLIDNGANIDGRTINNDTMLMLAVLNGRSHAVGCLLEKNADMEVRDGMGQTALMLAVRLGRTAADVSAASVSLDNKLHARASKIIVMWPFHLRRTAADVSAASVSLDNKLRARVSEAIYEEISSMLIAHGADVNIVINPNSEEESSVIVEAAKWGNLNVINALISSGANMGML